MQTYRGQKSAIISVRARDGVSIDAYLACPEGMGPFPAVVLVHHLPGWTDYYIETTRRFAHHGYLAICPNLFQRAGDGTPDDCAARVRAQGGVADDEVIDDLELFVGWVRGNKLSNGKVGLFGSCSGGRHSFLYACKREDVDACADLWGGRVVMAPNELSQKTPIAPIDLTEKLSCPLIGIFGNEDRAPSPGEVHIHESELRRFGKDFEFHRYDGAGHGFFYWHRPLYRPEQAMDGWEKILTFFKTNLTR
ncbi:dienelactone hydrolase family protein [Sinorhizobium medicae]|uniref:dienelactone hydrolase family protein n=1 Tax=Sinorhizobium medicae TaxID=110321 RepID=UPI000FD9AB0C|nr:dienelactone hydrolase family protein [Sinorhizobium medicae]